MKFSSVRGVLDSDPKGKTGVGTIFYLDVTVDDTTTRHTWGLLDELAGRFDPETILAPMKQAAENARFQAEAQEAKAKEEKLLARKAAIVIDPKMDGIMTAVLEKSEKALAEYRSGKEKALNSVVGQVMVAAKAQGFLPDAFAIKNLLVQKIDTGS